MTRIWRLILHPVPTDGAMNMAVDEAILHTVAAGGAPPTLRLYAWAPPCLSLGVAQFHAEADRARLDARGWDLVRRPTGGKAILHTDELTYSIAAPKDDPHVAGSIIDSYRRLSEGLAAGLRVLGLCPEADPADRADTRDHGPVCFEVPSHYEITAGGKKLIGSAQVRKYGGVLQHGTLPLVGDLARICDVLAFETPEARDVAKDRVRARALTLEEALGRAVMWESAAEALAQGFMEAFGLAWQQEALGEAEQAQAARIREEKYASGVWTERR